MTFARLRIMSKVAMNSRPYKITERMMDCLFLDLAKSLVVISTQRIMYAMRYKMSTQT